MIDLIISILRSGTPLVYVTLAGVIAQRAGVWNLGLEGLMIIGACATVLGIIVTGNFYVAMAIAILLCMLASALLWFVIDRLKANPIIAGLGRLGDGQQVMLKLTLPETDDLYSDLVHDPRVMRVLALSGGYTRAEA